MERWNSPAQTLWAIEKQGHPASAPISIPRGTLWQSSRTSEGLSEHQSAQDTGAGTPAPPSSPGGAALQHFRTAARSWGGGVGGVLLRLLRERMVFFVAILLLQSCFFTPGPEFQLDPQLDDCLLPLSTPSQGPGI